jgi:hypothetical protein
VEAERTITQASEELQPALATDAALPAGALPAGVLSSYCRLAAQGGAATAAAPTTEGPPTMSQPLHNSMGLAAFAALERLLRKAMELSGQLQYKAVTAWLDKWTLEKLEEKDLTVQVQGGRHRRMFQEAVDAEDAAACLELLKLIELLT